MSMMWDPTRNQWIDTDDPGTQTLLGGQQVSYLDQPATLGGEPGLSNNLPADYLPGGYDGFSAYQPSVPSESALYNPAPTGGAPSGGTPPSSGGNYAAPHFDGPYQPDYSYYDAPPGFEPPTFTPPPAFNYAPFHAPTGDDVLNDPGYAFRLGEGDKGIKQFASHLGGLRTGGTIKDLVKYNQNFASQEYGNVFNRDLDQYKTGYNSAADQYRTNYGVSRDVFDRNYTGARDAYAPKLLDWTSRNALGKEQADDYFNRTYDAYKFGLDDQYRNGALAAGQG